MQPTELSVAIKIVLVAWAENIDLDRLLAYRQIGAA